MVVEEKGGGRSEGGGEIGQGSEGGLTSKRRENKTELRKKRRKMYR